MLSFLPQFSDRVSVTFLAKDDDRDVPQPRVRLHQVHGNRTIVATEPSESTEQADGAITNTPGLHLMARAADCQNFAFYVPSKHVGGVLHAGWKGMLCDAVTACIQTLSETYDVTPEDIYVAAGPSLCLQCAEYRDTEHELRKQVDPIYVHGNNVDLRTIANDQLIKAGIPPNQIERHPDCTRCSPDKYLTYRGGDRSLVQSGVSNVLVLTLL